MIERELNDRSGVLVPGAAKRDSWDTYLKRLGDRMAIEYATYLNDGKAPDERMITTSRECDIDVIRSRFKQGVKDGLIPNWAKLKPFRVGWRGLGDGVKHGTVSTYIAGCRGRTGCAECKEAWRVHSKKRRENKQKEFEQLRLEKEQALADAEALRFRISTEQALERQRIAEEHHADTSWRMAVGIVCADEIGWGSFKGRMIDGVQFD